MPKRKSTAEPSAIGEKEAKKQAKDREKALARIQREAIKAIKKTGHHRTKLPWSEIKEALTREEALALMGNHGTVMSDTARMHRREFTPKEIVECFGLPKVISPVTFTGKVLAPIGMPVYIIAHAGYMKLEVKCESKMMTLRFRTRLLGSGATPEKFEGYTEW